MKKNVYWILVVLYATLIFGLSSYPLPGRIHFVYSSDKIVHIFEYGILASLIYLALKNFKIRKYKIFMLAFIIVFIYGLSDEIHQYFVPGRTADIFDVMANGVGAFCFPLAIQLKKSLTTYLH